MTNQTINQAIISKRVIQTVKFVGRPSKATIETLQRAGFNFGQSRQWYSSAEEASVVTEEDVVRYYADSAA